MISYKEAEWLKLVELARSDRECSPAEDEAVVWAADRIGELEAEIVAKDTRISELVEAIFNEIGEIE